MTTDRPLPAQPEAFTRFLEGLLLTDLRLSRCEAAVCPSEGPRTGARAIEFGHDAALVSATATSALVRASYGVRIVADDSPGAELARLLVVYDVSYTTCEEMTLELFEVFRAVSLRLHTIPFAREWLRETSARMGLEPILLPLALAHPAAVPPTKSPKRGSASKKR